MNVYTILYGIKILKYLVIKISNSNTHLLCELIFSYFKKCENEIPFS